MVLDQVEVLLEEAGRRVSWTFGGESEGAILSWWLERVERWQQLYAEGCLYVAQAYLVRSALQQAVEWSDRAIAATPWLEEAYQVKMRALARQGARTQALITYAAACQALARELGVSPSPLTERLAECLRRGEMI